MYNSIKWAHFSDLHFNFGDNFSSKQLREKLLRKIENDNIKLDFIIVTGDISNRGILDPNTLSFISDLIDKTKCSKDNLFLCCGNHDIERNETRTELISSYSKKKEQDKNYSIDDYGLGLLFKAGHKKFLDTYKIITGKSYGENAHFIEEREHYNIYIINTCIMSCKNDEEGNLLVCDNDLCKLSMNNTNNRDKLNIAIGHHSIECIHPQEKMQLISFFDSLNIDIYLCGHNHQIGYEKLSNSENGITQFMCGGVFKDNYNCPSFILYEYNLSSHNCTTEIYSFSNGNNSWNVMSDAIYPFKNGVYNFIPERLKPKAEENDSIATLYRKVSQTLNLSNYEDLANSDTQKELLDIVTNRLISYSKNLFIKGNKNIFQNNYSLILSQVENAQEKHMILCDRIFNKFYGSSKYMYIKNLEYLFVSSIQSSDLLAKTIICWRELVYALLNLEPSPENITFSSENYLDIIVSPIITNYEMLFKIASDFIIGDIIEDKSILSRLSITKKIIEDEKKVFFGYEEEIKTLKNIISRKDTGYYCIAADEGYGKTSLMSKLIGDIIESKVSQLNTGKVVNLLPWLPYAIVVFGKQVSGINDAINMLIEQANLLLVNPISYNEDTTKDISSFLYLTFEALSKELGGITLVIDAVDEFRASDLSFLPDNLPDGTTIFITARKFPQHFSEGKKNLYIIKHSGFTSKDDKAIMNYYGISYNNKEAIKLIHDILNKTNGWPLIICDIKKQIESSNYDLTKVKIETSLNSVFYRKKNMWKENNSTECCRWRLLGLFSIFANSSYLSRDNIQSYLIADPKYNKIHSEDIVIILDCVYDQLISNDGGFYKLKYLSFAEYIIDKKTGFTTIELRRVIEDITNWLCMYTDDNIDLIVPFHLAWFDYNDEIIKSEVEKVITTLINKNKTNILLEIASALLSRKETNNLIEKYFLIIIEIDEKAKYLYAKYLYYIKNTDNSKKEAIKLYECLVENGYMEAIIEYAGILIKGNEFIEANEKRAYELLNQVESKESRVIGRIYNIIHKEGSPFYDNDRSISILYMLAENNDISGMAILGTRLLDGKGIKQNKIEGEKWLRKAADAGGTEAMAILGARLFDGVGVGQNKVEGEKWIRKAAKAGDLSAMRMLGSKLIDGEGVKQSKQEGEKWLKKSAEGGNAVAMAELGSRLLAGISIKVNASEGEKLLRKAAKLKEPQAMQILGYRLINGDGIKQDILEGEQWLREAAYLGNVKAMYLLGLQLINGNILSKNIVEGENYLRKAAEQGNIQAMTELGWRLLDGDCLEQNILEGEKWLRIAAEAGELEAMYILGDRLIDGVNIPKNIIEGEQLLRSAATLGHLKTMYFFGLRLIGGKGIVQNTAEGEQLLRKAAMSGIIVAMYSLGCRLIDGEVLEKNIVEGEMWLKKAADAGDIDAITDYGSRLLNGIGLVKNSIEGERWLRKAIKAGDTDAMVLLGSGLLYGKNINKNVKEGISLCKLALEKNCGEAANTLGVYFCEVSDYQQSIYYLEKGRLLGNKNSNINLAYLIRKGLYTDYQGTPTVVDLLSCLVDERLTFALINYSLYLVSDLIVLPDWANADNLISLIDSSDNEIQNVIDWWKMLSDNGDTEGDLVIGWLSLREKLIDPDGLSPRERFSRANKMYSIPNWLLEMAQ